MQELKSTIPDVQDASVIPTARMNEMKTKYVEYKKKWPHMKEQRIAKKVAEYFKIKLV